MAMTFSLIFLKKLLYFVMIFPFIGTYNTTDYEINKLTKLIKRNTRRHYRLLAFFTETCLSNTREDQL